MNFDVDAFISYAQRDNEALMEGGKGWIQSLQHALERRVGQLSGGQVNIFPKFSGSDTTGDTRLELLGRAAALVSVVSPTYVNSESARKEVTEFWKAAEAQGGVRLGDKNRVFKVVKTPVPREKEALELQPLAPYEFFKFNPESGKVRELDPNYGSQAQFDFMVRLDDLAQDVCSLLKILENPQSASDREHLAVFLAEATSDLRDQRDAIKRDLQQHGYTVLPARSLPQVASDVRASVIEDLSRCRMSVHMVGKTYGVVPEGGTMSLLEIQNELAIERGKKGGFSRLLWIPAGLRVEDERQRMLVEQIRMDPRIQEGADLLETYLEDLRTEVLDRLKHAKQPVQSVVANVARVYLMYDRRDAEAIAPWADFLFEHQLEVIHPMFEGDEGEIREFHEDNLRTCDGALIFHGVANEFWLRRKLAELRKSAGYGRVNQIPVVRIVQIPPRNVEKERFRTHEAEIIAQWSGPSPDLLQPFVSECLQRRPVASIDKFDPDETIRPLGIGTKLGPYEIVAELGSGGMGQVFRARDHRLDCDVAIKILRKGLLAGDDGRRRFREEAKALAKLRYCQNIAVIHDVGQEAGMNYLVMEFVPGETLAEKLKSGPLAENELVSIGAQVAEALEVAHEHSVVHRDLKPANIMVSTRGRVKVLDFGLAKLLGPTGGIPEAQSLAGTPPYMAPEQLKGEPVDARTDLYALGNVLFEMAAARKPFLEQSIGRLSDAIQHQTPVHLQELNPELSADLDRIVAKALEKDRELRYQSAAEMRADLARIARAGT
jgi:hypothetical protein